MKFLLASLLAVAVWASELKVSTTSGIVQGFYNDSSTHTVRAFLGIPYAQPPVGTRRWAPPVAKHSPRDRVDGREYGPACPFVSSFSETDIYSVLPYGPADPDNIAEDCLFLNIWAPSRRKNPRGAAVLVFIHGGAFVSGTSSAVPFQDGTPFVRDNKDVIVVTFNYRVGIFGFPNAPGLPDGLRNVGLLDQRLAVEWLRDNIAHFGGDPSRIMLFGQSAGAISTDMYAYAYHHDPIVHAIGLESGTATLLSSADYAHTSWRNVSSQLGCPQHDVAKDLACMRRLDFRTILTLGVGQPFFPVQDNRTAFSNYTHRAKLGKVARVPVLIGSNAREGAAGSIDGPAPDESTVQTTTRAMFTCPAGIAAEQRTSLDIPVWRYLYHGNWTNISPAPFMGAYHSSEIPMVFGTYWLAGPATGDQALVSKYMQGAWSAFAQDPLGGLTAYGWPVYNPKNEAFAQIALENDPLPTFLDKADGGDC
ncbi:Alpha/Beta hydrolase protein [Aspergillus carlsbadensis]|nr:Alpha/Beta hydrolase protein [Aspergillus carlsbadensis]